jgi:putative ABC transport system permease protein
VALGAVRRLARKPGQSAVAVAALALGIGLTGAMAAIVQGSFLRGLPFDDADLIVHVARRPLLEGGVLAAEATAWRDAAAAGEIPGVERVAAWIGVGGVWNGDPLEVGVPAERRNGAFASPELFAVTGAAARPVLGRLFVPEDDLPGAEPVVLLSDALWRERYGGDPEILGRSVRIFGRPATVVGVLPPGFQFPLSQQFWLPLGPLVATMPDTRLPVQVVARLDAESTARGDRERIARTLDGMADRIAHSVGAPGAVSEGRDDPDAISTTVSPFVAAYTQDVRGPLWLATGAALCVLLIACANVGNLLLARGLARSRELAVRAALGAGRKRLAGGLLGEAAVLASAGGVLGLGIAWAAVRLYRSDVFGAGLVPSFWADVRLDPASLLVVLAATGFTALAAGTLPALRAGRVAPARVLSRGDGRGATGSPTGSPTWSQGRWTGALVVVQIALSSALLVGTALMLESVRGLEAHDFGERPERVFTGGVNAGSGTGSAREDREGPAGWLRTYDELARRVGELPGVGAVGYTGRLPTDRTPVLAAEVEGGLASPLGSRSETRVVAASPGYFEALGRPPLVGRAFVPADREGAEPVVVVDRVFAETYLVAAGGDLADALGRRVRFLDPRSSPSKQPDDFRRVVGVVPSLLLDWRLYEETVGPGTPPGAYVPLAQSPEAGVRLVARNETSRNLAPEIRAILASIDPDIPLTSPGTLADAVAETSGEHRRMRALLSLFAGAALLLAGLGLYGVLSFTVGARLRELGIRAALGARREDLALRVGRTVLVEIGLGLSAGLVAGALGSRLLGGLLYGIRPGDPAAYLAAALTLLAAATLACAGPLHRATRLDPARVLRAE